MRKIIRWAIICGCSWGIAWTLASLMEKYELVATLLSIVGIMCIAIALMFLLVWVLMENDEEEEEEDDR